MWVQEGREWDAAAGDSKWKLKERIRAAMEEDSRFTVIPPTPVRRRLVGDDLIYNHFTSIEPRIIDYARLGMNYFYHEELEEEDAAPVAEAEAPAADDTAPARDDASPATDDATPASDDAGSEEKPDGE